MTVLNATAATIKATLKTAKGGDTVILAGPFDHVVIASLTFSPAINIDARAATFVNVQIKACTGIIWTGGAFSPVDWAGGVYVSGCHGITVQGVSVSDAPDRTGVTLRDSFDVHVLSGVFAGLKSGVSVINCDGFGITDSAFDAMSGDSLHAFNSRNGAILRNRSQGNIRTATHPDFAQVRDCDDVEIRGNTVYGATQGINNFGSKSPTASNRITVQDNVLVLAMPQAIAFDGLKAGVVRNNSIFTIPGSANQAAMRITNADAQTVVSGNRTAAYSRWPAKIDVAG